jgi:hypothetical protein
MQYVEFVYHVESDGRTIAMTWRAAWGELVGKAMAEDFRNPLAEFWHRLAMLVNDGWRIIGVTADTARPRRIAHLQHTSDVIPCPFRDLNLPTTQ